MTPAELAVYDNYPVWFGHLAELCSAAQALPLEHLLAANFKITLTGGVIGPGQTEPATAEQMDRQRELIEKVIAFRNSLAPAADAS